MTRPMGEAPAEDVDAGAAPCVYMTADLSGAGGVIKQRPEDFLVEEQPLYQPAGSGEHIYLLVEKQGITTPQLVGLLADHFGVDRRAIGFAGLKDKLAITRQVVSIHTPGRCLEDFPELTHDRIRILWADMHTNKLRRGHLRGNRFSIKIRGVSPGKAPGAHRILLTLTRLGAPNRFGEQRFGVHRNNHHVGRAILLGLYQEAADALLGARLACVGAPDAAARALYDAGDMQGAIEAFPAAASAERRVARALASGDSPKKALRRVGLRQRQLWISAFQSAIFNRLLDERLDAGTLAELHQGDIACKHDNGALFDVDADALADPSLTARLEALEISPTGPLWGPKMKQAKGATGELELRALEETGVTADALTRSKMAMAGDRRPLRTPVLDPSIEAGVDEFGEHIRCAFELPPGAYATEVMREIMKPSPPENELEAMKTQSVDGAEQTAESAS